VSEPAARHYNAEYFASGFIERNKYPTRYLDPTGGYSSPYKSPVTPFSERLQFGREPCLEGTGLPAIGRLQSSKKTAAQRPAIAQPHPQHVSGT